MAKSSQSSSRAPSVLITAGTKRLGLVFAKKLLSMGFDLVLHYRSDASETEKWISSEPAIASRITLVQADLTENAADVVRQAKKEHPRLVGLINNASVFTKGDLHDPPHLFEALHTNAFVPAALGAAFTDNVRGGWIINVTDAKTSGTLLSFQNYRLSKRLLTDLTEQMALAYAPKFRVNAIAPGAMLPSRHATKSEFRALAKKVPLGKVGMLDSLVRAMEYLVEENYVTGQVMFVDGGWHLN